MDENPRMPLTYRGLAYALFLTAVSIVFSYFMIRGLGIEDSDYQYAITISSIVFFIGVFFCRDKVLIGIKRRSFFSLVFAVIVLLTLLLIDLIFQTFFSV